MKKVLLLAALALGLGACRATLVAGPPHHPHPGPYPDGPPPGHHPDGPPPGHHPDGPPPEHHPDGPPLGHHPEGGWEKLGERVVNGRVDHDVIGDLTHEGCFHKVQFTVHHSALEMFNMVITFKNGEHFSPDTRLIFGRGDSSRQIDLPGDCRVIRRVDFRYGNLPGGGNAHIEVFAK